MPVLRVSHDPQRDLPCLPQLRLDERVQRMTTSACTSQVEQQVIEALRCIGVRPGFFGVVAFSFKDGRLVLIGTERTSYPNELASHYTSEEDSTHARERH